MPDKEYKPAPGVVPPKGDLSVASEREINLTYPESGGLPPPLL